jgi:hypothetical protein
VQVDEDPPFVAAALGEEAWSEWDGAVAEADAGAHGGGGGTAATSGSLGGLLVEPPARGRSCSFSDIGSVTMRSSLAGGSGSGSARQLSVSREASLSGGEEPAPVAVGAQVVVRASPVPALERAKSARAALHLLASLDSPSLAATFAPPGSDALAEEDGARSSGMRSVSMHSSSMLIGGGSSSFASTRGVGSFAGTRGTGSFASTRGIGGSMRIGGWPAGGVPRASAVPGPTLAPVALEALEALEEEEPTRRSDSGGGQQQPFSPELKSSMQRQPSSQQQPSSSGLESSGSQRQPAVQFHASTSFHASASCHSMPASIDSPAGAVAPTGIGGGGDGAHSDSGVHSSSDQVSSSGRISSSRIISGRFNSSGAPCIAKAQSTMEHLMAVSSAGKGRGYHAAAVPQPEKMPQSPRVSGNPVALRREQSIARLMFEVADEDKGAAAAAAAATQVGASNIGSTHMRTLDRTYTRTCTCTHNTHTHTRNARGHPLPTQVLEHASALADAVLMTSGMQRLVTKAEPLEDFLARAAHTPREVVKAAVLNRGQFGELIRRIATAKHSKVTKGRA